MKILVVDDEEIKRITLADDLGTQGHDVVAAADGQEAMDHLRASRFDVVITDVKMPKVDGLELLKFIKQGEAADTAVVMMTAYGSIQLAVESMKLGAFDFVTKPFRNDDIFPLLARIEREQGVAEQRAEALPRPAVSDIDRAIVGSSAAMNRVKRMVDICTRTDANVLLWGETGVGKDLIASVIHRNSHRHEFPFVKVGCTLFPSHLIESELYGHEKGSFTGADQKRPGRFELAEGGSLYLDDVDDIPLEHQSKLLRAIEEKVFERVGGATPIKADVRIITSTKCNLLDKISEGTFRQDLYYRLDVLRVTIPPLRERRDDIPLLVAHLMQRIAGDADYHVEPSAVEVLQSHSWPGNVRELYHTLERAFLVGAGRITADMLSTEIIRDFHRSDDALPTEGFQAEMDKTERALLERALRQASGNKTAAAAALGMKPSTFRDKLAKHGLG